MTHNYSTTPQTHYAYFQWIKHERPLTCVQNYMYILTCPHDGPFHVSQLQKVNGKGPQKIMKFTFSTMGERDINDLFVALSPNKFKPRIWGLEAKLSYLLFSDTPGMFRKYKMLISKKKIWCNFIIFLCAFHNEKKYIVR